MPSDESARDWMETAESIMRMGAAGIRVRKEIAPFAPSWHRQVRCSGAVEGSDGRDDALCEDGEMRT